MDDFIYWCVHASALELLGVAILLFLLGILLITSVYKGSNEKEKNKKYRI